MDKGTHEKRILIAQLAESILNKPDGAFLSNAGQFHQEEHFSKEKKQADGSTSIEERNGEEFFGRLSKMRMLLELANPNPKLLPFNDEHTARLAMVSLLAVFQDILPTYRIRLPTEEELTVRVSKDVKKTRDYERNLLSNYQSYLKLLTECWKNGQPKKAKNRNDFGSSPSPLAITAILSLCSLLKTAYLFNFRSNIVSIVIRSMNSKCEEVRTSCCDAVKGVFKKDTQGDVSLEIVQAISTMIKNRGYQVNADVIRTFLSLPLRVHEDEAEAAKIHEKAQKKKRKRDQERAAIEDELKEGSANVDKALLARAQAESLQAVVLTYFRILKSRTDGRKTTHLLSSSLEGLAKFSHLINIDTVEDLLVHLKELLADVETLSLDAALNCILTAFSALQGPGRELQIDQKEYVAPLYGQLTRLSSQDNTEYTKKVLKCLNFAFFRRREYSTERVASFIKQLCTVSLHAPSHTSGAMLAFARMLFHRYPTSHQLLENESDVVASGKYSPEVHDPDHANPFATSAWELATLNFHIHPELSAAANAAVNLKMPQLPKDGPENVFERMASNTNDLYIKFQRSKKKHPLKTSMQKRSNKRQRNQYRFITPRETGNWHMI